MKNTPIQLINDNKTIIKCWINNSHDKPINYLYYLSNNKNIQFDKFCFDYHKKNINILKADYKQYICKYTNLNYISDINIIDKLDYLQNGSFVSLDIKLYIENYIDSYEKYNFPHLNMDFYYSSKIDNKYKINTIMNFYIISKWIHQLFGKSTQIINFVYFDTPIAKKIIISNDFLSSQNVNSGSSSVKMIMIWRSEESIKVFIHELIHYLDKDVKYDYNFDNIIKIKLGNINYPILINETITELQAQLFHTIYITNYLNKINDNYNLNISNFKTLYNYEHIFSWYQFAKIMDFYSIKKFKEEYLINNFNQSSNIFSYYILKSIIGLKFSDILFKLDHINELINNKPTQNINKINFDKSDEKIKLIYPLNISNHLHNKPEICNVNNCQELVKYIKKYINKLPIKLINKVIKYLKLNDDSLKMTILELDI
jgi:hypothetical protein